MKNWLLSIALALISTWAPITVANSSDYEPALRAQIDSTLQRGCENPTSNLARVLCDKRIRVGVRTNYRLFGEFDGSQFKGFEIDLAKLIAQHLGVQAHFEGVTAANRIEKLLNDDVDMILATMAHTLTRDAIVHFILPHYYASPTVIVGAKKDKITAWSDLQGKSVCVPLGNFSNIAFSANQVRLLIYDRPDRMIDALRLGACSIIAHDKSLLQANVFGPLAPKDLSARFEEKISSFDVPWGIGVRNSAKEDLGLALSLIMAELHRSGAIESLAHKHFLHIDFLAEQHNIFSNTKCLSQNQLNPTCLGEPVDVTDKPTTIAPTVNKLENWLKSTADLSLKFPMLAGISASSMFITGLGFSLLLVAGAILTTLIFAFLFLQLLRSKFIGIRICGHIVVQFFQNSPIILLLVLGYLVITFFTSYSPLLAVVVSIIVIGLNNGANGCSAMYDKALASGPEAHILVIAKKTSTQLRAAVVNATKASPVAAFIGAPEMLSVLTDITSFSGERTTTFLMVSIFYLTLVQMVIVLSGRVTKRLEKND
jgi:ABC-type amino acid transport substrate-binding protein/ABC-type amino acid transport system permease subunit